MTAGITAFYMFRLWFFTFAGQPRDHHVYEHAQESPAVMTGPLIVLSFFAIFVAIGGEKGPLYKLLTHSEPAGVAAGLSGGGRSSLPPITRCTRSTPTPGRWRCWRRSPG